MISSLVPLTYSTTFAFILRIALTLGAQRHQNAMIELYPVHTRVVSRSHLDTVIYLLIVPLSSVLWLSPPVFKPVSRTSK